MARYYITAPGFTYRGGTGRTLYVNPQFEKNLIFDETDPAREVDSSFVPPIVGLLPMDTEAKIKIDAVRAPYAGVQTPGIGTVPADTPIYSP